jgi:hypothetical protein
MNSINVSKAANYTERPASKTAKHFANNESSGVIQFPTQNKENKQARKGWVCNLSRNYVFSQQHHEYLQIQPSETYTQFDLICRLIDADTCRVIYFDEQLTQVQLSLLRQRLICSKTEILHAKVAFMFSKEVSTLYA